MMILLMIFIHDNEVYVPHDNKSQSESVSSNKYVTNDDVPSKSKKYAKKSKKKVEKNKVVLKANRTPSKKVPTPSKKKKTPKKMRMLISKKKPLHIGFHILKS